MPYRYLEDSCVRYEEGDALGQLLAYCSLGHIFVVIAYITLIVAVRDIHIIGAFATQLVGAKLTSILKKVISQPRPENSDIGGSGMPSNHSQFLFFFAVFHALCLCLCTGTRNRPAGKRPSAGLPAVWCTVYSACLFSFAGAVAYSRVYLEYHTTEQVVAGSLLGCVLGAVSFYLLYANAYVGGIMRWLCEQSLVRSARVYYSPEFYYPPRPPPLGEAKEE